MIHPRISSMLIDASLENLSTNLGRMTLLDFFTSTFVCRNSLLAASSSSLRFEAV